MRVAHYAYLVAEADTEITRLALAPLAYFPHEFREVKLSRSEITESSFPTCSCVCLRSSRSCWSALPKSGIVLLVKKRFIH